ncbi:hypothetical protein DVH24_034888 [Malus domestica]|uniref:Uncharacterized protein n=1 Tax=Malus domestica TaxID=3750 RepID=A0A498IHH7_MALDO|nr:hypothetical protein DVH24_034888 [Malus domestica]
MPNLMLDDDAFLASATIDWRNPRAASKEENVRGIVEMKIHDRLGTWRAKLRKLYYVPFENSEQRKHCDDPRVIQTQWQALVAHWDKMENKRRCATNAKNRKMLKTSHTIGTTTFAQISNDYAEEHDGNESHVGTCSINIGSFGVGTLQSTSTQQQGCGSSHAHISTLFEGGNDKNVQCGPPVSSAMMHEDCQSENTVH